MHNVMSGFMACFVQHTLSLFPLYSVMYNLQAPTVNFPTALNHPLDIMSDMTGCAYSSSAGLVRRQRVKSGGPPSRLPSSTVSGWLGLGRLLSSVGGVLLSTPPPTGQYLLEPQPCVTSACEVVYL